MKWTQSVTRSKEEWIRKDIDLDSEMECCSLCRVMTFERLMCCCETNRTLTCTLTFELVYVIRKNMETILRGNYDCRTVVGGVAGCVCALTRCLSMCLYVCLQIRSIKQLSS